MLITHGHWLMALASSQNNSPLLIFFSGVLPVSQLSGLQKPNSVATSYPMKAEKS
jgi:hypothetical protein